MRKLLCAFAKAALYLLAANLQGWSQHRVVDSPGIPGDNDSTDTGMLVDVMFTDVACSTSAAEISPSSLSWARTASDADWVVKTIEITAAK